MNEEILAGDTEAAPSPFPPAGETAGSGAPGSPVSLDEVTGDPASPGVLHALRKELGNLREQNRLYQAALLAARSRPEKGPEKPLPGDDEPLTFRHARAMAGRLDEISREIAFMRFSGDHPDFVSAINEHLPGMVAENPGLMPAILASPVPLVAAYDAVSKSPGYKARQIRARASDPADLARTVERIVKNAEKPGGALGSAGAAFTPAERIRRMSADEFRALTEEVKNKG